jgi:arabinose-5-phosphate isomerase
MMVKASSTHFCDLEEARKVLDLEIKGLETLKTFLDASFSVAVETISSLKGRLIVTGMGKSGHVARKIASTLASTGTPAFFIHPAEAGHGDLGMILPGDAVLALSYSGETKELEVIIRYTSRRGIPLMAMTQKKESALSKEANITLLLPMVPEACPNGLAPTTSSTMMMALGDALAVVLLTKKGFSKEDFKSFHPGGNLGNRLKRVKEIMHTKNGIPSVEEGTPMIDAIQMMTSKKFGCVGIVNGSGQLTGIITDGDLRRHMEDGLSHKMVTDVMTKSPKTISPDALLEEAFHLMQGSITVLFVVDEDRIPVGLLHIHDLLRIGLV